MSEKEGGGRTRGGGRGGRGMCCVLSHANPKVSLQGKRGVAQQRACSALSEGELDGVPGVPVDTSSASPMPATTTPATNGLRGLPPATPPGVPPPRPPGAPPEPTECSGGRESAGARRPSGSGAPALAPPAPAPRLALASPRPARAGGQDAVEGSGGSAAELACAVAGRLLGASA